MKKFLLAIPITALAVLFFSCGEDDPPLPPAPTLPAERTFRAINLNTEQYYNVRATLLAEGAYGNIWVENGSGVNEAAAKAVADEYDNIYSMMIKFFSEKNISNPFPSGSRTYSDIMQFALALTGESKVCILLLDIKDNYIKDVNDSYVAGYFDPGNVFDEPDSNRSVMIYIDINPLKAGLEMYKTLAHEMQHLMNFANSFIYRVIDNTLYGMDMWIDEGLSAAAEWIYERENGIEHSDDKLKWFNQNDIVNGKINVGNNFFVWGNRDNESPYAVLDDYATVYLFFQWLRLQSGGSTGIYLDIITSTGVDYSAVTKAAHNKISTDYGNDWGKLLRDWLAANYINADGGRYGYMDDPVLKTIKAPTAPADTTKLSLYPGEGVYSIVNSSYSGGMPTSGANSKIAYVGLNNSGDVIGSAIDVNTTAALLTYNIDTVNYVVYNDDGTITPLQVEDGTVTGIAASVGISQTQGRFAGEPLGPFRISATDMLRLNGRGSSNIRIVKVKE
jgi:hypothetical protein